jgi:hypothetical protein
VPRITTHYTSARALLCAAVLALNACVAVTLPPRPEVILAATPEHFSVCHGYSCRDIDTLALDPAQLKTLTALFDKPPPDAAAERKRLATAIASMERWVGPRTGTDHDLGGTFPGFGKPGQMDCIDESTNTTTYLTLFASRGWLRFHRVAARMTRGFLPLAWPHTTAVIIETATGQRYAVDSWFLDNGQPPFILPLEIWQAGWKPPR